MKRFNWLLMGLLVVCLAIIPLTGCVAKSEYEALQAEHATLVQEKASLTQENNSLKAELEATQSDLTKAQAEYDVLNADYETVNEELTEINKVYPPRDFNSVTELEGWVSNHTQPTTLYLDGTFRSALRVQSQGLADGYLISVMYDEDDTDPSGGWIFCGALVNGHLYIWNPEIGQVHSWYADWLCR